MILDPGIPVLNFARKHLVHDGRRYADFMVQLDQACIVQIACLRVTFYHANIVYCLATYRVTIQLLNLIALR